MGDIGEYWREHKEYKAKVARRRAGITASDERRWERERITEKRSNHLAKCTVKCECEKWFIDDNAHKCHKAHKGKVGHKIVDRKSAAQKEETHWSDVI